MSTVDTNQISARYELKSELARFCLPAANRDPNRKLAWVNSICILFLIIGIFGARNGSISVRAAPPVEEIVPTIIQPSLPLPPSEAASSENHDQDKQEESGPPQAVVVTLESPSINFAVPTIGTLVVPNAVASAPPLKPLQPRAVAGGETTTLGSTGGGGERPQPPYPQIALEQGDQGTVTLLMSADEAGNVISIDVKESSGFQILDHSAVEYIKRHWTLPPGPGTRQFETSITYVLQAN
jgi:periplasmic protein TonB